MKHTKKLLSLLLVLCLILSLSCTAFATDEAKPLTGKTVIPFATSGGSGMGGTNKALAPSCKGAKLLEGKVFRSSTNADTLREWVKTLK